MDGTCSRSSRSEGDLKTLPLVKAHAYGNDFLLVDGRLILPVDDVPDLARRACDRHRGVGADGLIVAHETPRGAFTRLLNADGSPSEVSGNGVRCVAAWLASSRTLSPGASLQIETGAGPRQLVFQREDAGRLTFRAGMGPPADLRQERLDVAGEVVTAIVMRVGNPQCVVLGPLSLARLHTLAAGLAVHPFFPEGTNVELATVEAADRVRILIWERGVGPTEASGTGACAAGVAAAAFGGAARSLDVVAPGGYQRVEWTDEQIFLTGWAQVIATIDWRVD